MSARWREPLEAALESALCWDEGVEAARNACVAGAPLAAAAITAAAWYDNPLQGSRALLSALRRFRALPLELGAWLSALTPAPAEPLGVAAFVSGFGFSDAAASAHLLETARALRARFPGARLDFWLEHRLALEARAGALNFTGLCALAFADARLDDDAAEREFLLLRLRPALAEAQRAKRAGLAQFPFFETGYAYEGAWPARAAHEACSEQRLAQLRLAVGLDP